MRAGRVVSGEDAVESAARRGKVQLLIVAEDASENTRRKFSALARSYRIPEVISGKKELLGQAIGRAPRAVVGVTDRGFARMLSESVQGSVQENDEE